VIRKARILSRRGRERAVGTGTHLAHLSRTNSQDSMDRLFFLLPVQRIN
jgi:hypothetical protein